MTQVCSKDITAFQLIVMGLQPGTGSQEVMDIFSSCGEVTGVQLGMSGNWLVDFRCEEYVVSAEKAELLQGGCRLTVARSESLPEHEPAAQPVYSGTDSYYYPLPVQFYPQSAPNSPYPQVASPVHYTSNATPVSDSRNTNVFTFNSEQIDLSAIPLSTKAEGTPGNCYVCSNHSQIYPAPQFPSQLPQPPLFYIGPPPGHQLQPLTPITPSTHPTVYYSQFAHPYIPAPTYAVPPTPGYYTPYQLPVYDNPLMYQQVPPHPLQVGANELGKSDFTKLKQSDQPMNERRDSTGESNKAVKGRVSYFTSPFKTFSKFSGTPTPTRFPLQRLNHGSGRGGKKSGGEKGNLYQEGVRWGQRDGGTGWAGWENKKEIEEKSKPDLVKDLESCRIKD